MKFNELLFVSVLALAGCASYGTQVSQQQQDAFEKGKTTEADVIKQLGQPTIVRTEEGRHELGYAYSKAQADAASWIPIVGAFVGKTKFEGDTVFFKFDQQGKFVGTITEHTQGEAGLGGTTTTTTR